MGVAVNKTGNERLTGGVDYPGLGADAAFGIKAAVSDFITLDQEGSAFKQFAGVDVDNRTIDDRQVGIGLAQGDFAQFIAFKVDSFRLRRY